jgi:hypothetical protein
MDPMAFFIQMMQQGARIRLLNVYKGVPIAYEASFVQLGNSTIRLRTSLYQVACLYRDKETFIQATWLPDILRARVLALDAIALEVELGDFSPVPEGIGERQQVRVHTEEPLLGAVFTPGMGEAYRAELADLSAEGLAVYIPRRNFYPTVYRPGVKITITLQLPGEYDIEEKKASGPLTGALDPMQRFSRESLRSAHTPGTGHPDESRLRKRVPFPEINIHGQIANLREEAVLGRVRAGVHISPGDPSRSVIQRFISLRQAEIVRELQTLYNLISKEENR